MLSSSCSTDATAASVLTSWRADVLLIFQCDSLWSSVREIITFIPKNMFYIQISNCCNNYESVIQYTRSERLLTGLHPKVGLKTLIWSLSWDICKSEPDSRDLWQLNVTNQVQRGTEPGCGPWFDANTTEPMKLPSKGRSRRVCGFSWLTEETSEFCLILFVSEMISRWRWTIDKFTSSRSD